MKHMVADEIFEKGISLLRENNTLAALSCFERACERGSVTGIKSYLGLCLAIERGKVKEGITLCNEAISEDPGNPVHYLHLGRIHLREKRKQEAIAIFRKGLSCGDNEEICRILDSLGTRKRPLLPFLARDHFLNKYSGKLLRTLRLR